MLSFDQIKNRLQYFKRQDSNNRKSTHIFVPGTIEDDSLMTEVLNTERKRPMSVPPIKTERPITT